MNVPGILYKYTSADTVKIVIESGKLRFSSPCQFNDPNELQRMPVFKPTIEEGWDDYLIKIVNIAYGNKTMDLAPFSIEARILINALRASGKEKKESLEILRTSKVPQQEQMEKQQRECTENINNGSIRIFCLTEDPANDVMWSHYAESHTGCMLGFRHLPELDTPFIAAEPVQYSENPPDVGSSVDFLLYGVTQTLKAKTRIAIYYTKNINWSYEKEWRVLTRRPAMKDVFHSDFKFYDQELESLTFGSKIREKDEIEIKNLIIKKYPTCKLFKAYNARGTLIRKPYAKQG